MKSTFLFLSLVCLFNLSYLQGQNPVIPLERSTHTRNSSLVPRDGFNFDWGANTSLLDSKLSPMTLSYVFPLFTELGTSVFEWLWGANVYLSQQIFGTPVFTTKLNVGATQPHEIYHVLGVDYQTHVEVSSSLHFTKNVLIGFAYGYKLEKMDMLKSIHALNNIFEKDMTAGLSGSKYLSETYFADRKSHCLEIEMAFQLARDYKLALGANLSRYSIFKDPPELSKLSDRISKGEKVNSETVATLVEEVSDKDKTNKEKAEIVDKTIEDLVKMSPTELMEKVNGKYLWGAGASFHIDHFLFLDSMKLGFNYVFALKDTRILWMVDF